MNTLECQLAKECGLNKDIFGIILEYAIIKRDRIHINEIKPIMDRYRTQKLSISDLIGTYSDKVVFSNILDKIPKIDIKDIINVWLRFDSSIISGYATDDYDYICFTKKAKMECNLDFQNFKECVDMKLFDVFMKDFTKQICDEILGEDNCIDLDKMIASGKEHILYRMYIDDKEFKGLDEEETNDQLMFSNEAIVKLYPMFNKINKYLDGRKENYPEGEVNVTYHHQLIEFLQNNTEWV